jgi:hypothetical protein
MKLMANHSSATVRETPYSTETTTNNIFNSLKRRAQSILNNRSIDAQSRAIIRYALETNDPWLAQLVRRAEAGETIVDNFEELAETTNDHPNEEKIEALTEIICRAVDEPEIKAAALLVLMATLENSPNPKALANKAKQFAFTRCGELNVYGVVDAQIVVAEGELLMGNTLMS